MNIDMFMNTIFALAILGMAVVGVYCLFDKFCTWSYQRGVRREQEEAFRTDTSKQIAELRQQLQTALHKMEDVWDSNQELMHQLNHIKEGQDEREMQ